MASNVTARLRLALLRTDEQNDRYSLCRHVPGARRSSVPRVMQVSGRICSRLCAQSNRQGDNYTQTRISVRRRNTAAVELDCPLCDRKTETGTASHAVAICLHAIECIEDSRQSIA